jgi:hypothetical protein
MSKSYNHGGDTFVIPQEHVALTRAEKKQLGRGVLSLRDCIPSGEKCQSELAKELNEAQAERIKAFGAFATRRLENDLKKTMLAEAA